MEKKICELKLNEIEAVGGASTFTTTAVTAVKPSTGMPSVSLLPPC